MQMKRLLTIAGIALIAASAWGQATTGTGQWLHDCWVKYQQTDSGASVGPADWHSVGLFEGFVISVSESIQVLTASNPKLNIDIPPSVTYGQLWAVVGKYLDAHPEQWNWPAYLLVLGALSDTWPRN
jgi:Rap1a immunity proteins